MKKWFRFLTQPDLRKALRSTKRRIDYSDLQALTAPTVNPLTNPYLLEHMPDLIKAWIERGDKVPHSEREQEALEFWQNTKKANKTCIV